MCEPAGRPTAGAGEGGAAAVGGSTHAAGVMKPCSMSVGSGGSTLNGCLPVKRTRSGWRGTQLSGVSTSRPSIFSQLISLEFSGDGMSCRFEGAGSLSVAASNVRGGRTN